MKKLRKLYRKSVQAVLPKWVAHRLIRKALRIQADPPSGVTFKIASTKEELEGAFRQLHDGFVREGYMEPSASGMRITPYHALPTSVVIIVLKGKEVIATISLFPAGTFGIPLQKSFDLSGLLAEYPRTVEISSLAVDPKHSGARGEILFPLMKYMYHCNRDLLKIDAELVGVNPKMAPLYEALLLFKPLRRSKPLPYAFVNNAPVVPMFFRFSDAEQVYERVFGDAPEDRNMKTYFSRPPHVSFELPGAEDLKHILPQLKPDLFRYFFVEKCPIIQSLSPEELQRLRTLYSQHPEIQEVIDFGRNTR